MWTAVILHFCKIQLLWSFPSSVLNLISEDYSAAWGEEFGLSVFSCSILDKRFMGFVCFLSVSWRGFLNRRTLTVVNVTAHREVFFPWQDWHSWSLSKLKRLTGDWPNTNGPFKRSASHLLMPGHKELGTVTRTKGLKGRILKLGWLPQHKGGQNKAMKCISPFFFFGPI